MPTMVWTGQQVDVAAAWRYAEIKRRPDTSKVQSQYEVKDEYWSILGMMAFAVEFSQPLILLTPDEPSDFGEDFNCHSFKVDVKTTVHPQGRLVYRWGTRYSADVYVLAVVDKESDTVRLVGWAWKDELLKGEEKDWGDLGKPCRTLRQNQLRPMSTFRRDLLLEQALAA